VYALRRSLRSRPAGRDNHVRRILGSSRGDLIVNSGVATDSHGSETRPGWPRQVDRTRGAISVLAVVIASAICLAEIISVLVGAWAVEAKSSNAAHYWIDRASMGVMWWHKHLPVNAASIGLSILALIMCRRTLTPPRARRHAVLALYLGVLGLLVALVCPLPLGLLLARAFDARLETCLSNLTRLAQSIQLYCADNDGRVPLARDWSQALQPYLAAPSPLTCPEVGTASSYALNSRLAGVSLGALSRPGETVLVFESDVGINAAGTQSILVPIPRHLGRDTFGFADGHGAYRPRRQVGVDQHGNPIWTRKPEANSVRWEP